MGKRGADGEGCYHQEDPHKTLKTRRTQGRQNTPRAQTGTDKIARSND